MLAIAKSKWIASIFLASILLPWSLLGSGWGTEFKAIAFLSTAPHIDSINPSHVLEDSPSILMTISGNNFGDFNDTAVRLKGNGYDNFLIPTLIQTERIYVLIPYYYLVTPAIYSITVVICDMGPVPIIPPPSCAEESNPVPFSVVERKNIFLPILRK